LVEKLWIKVAIPDAKVQCPICRGANGKGVRRIIDAAGDWGEFVVSRIVAQIVEQNGKGD